jgi:hypothetical protein
VTVDPTALALDLAREEGLLEQQGMASGGLVRSLAGLAVRIVGLGWATVDLERATADLTADPAADPDTTDRARAGGTLQDELLGARARPIAASADGLVVVVLEPFTEGRIARALAHRGEGPAALYLAPADADLAAAVDRLAADGIRTRLGQTALGPGALVLGGPPAGPQVLLVAVPSEP